MGQVAQLVEHATENRGVGGSIPSLAIGESRSVAQFGRAPVSKTGGWGFESLRACTESCPHRLTVRTPLFQGGDRGSIPREGIGRVDLAKQEKWGCSSVWLECRSVTPEAAGSSPVSPAGRWLKTWVVERVFPGGPPGASRLRAVRWRGLFVHVRTAGAVAQLGERLNGIQEVRGSTPLGSIVMDRYAGRLGWRNW